MRPLDLRDLLDGQQVQLRRVVNVRVMRSAQQQQVLGLVTVAGGEIRIGPGAAITGRLVVGQLSQTHRAQRDVGFEQVAVADRATAS